MRKSLSVVLLILASAGFLSAALNVYQVPDLPGGNEKPSIARNALGDMLIVYRNNVGGAAFYYRSHAGGTLGPKIIDGQTYEQRAKENIVVTDIAVDPSGNFHTVWNFDIHAGAWGLYYAVFDITTERWSAPSRLESGKVEGPKLSINPLTNDLVLVYDSFLGSINKDIFIKIKTGAGWQNEVDLSHRTQEEATLARRKAVPATSAGDDRTGIQAPHGELAETNPSVAIDETDGYVYVTWKEDKWNEARAKWELQIVVALLDPSYNMVWFDRVTHDYEGYHVLPTIAAVNGRAMMAFAWPQEAGYYYIHFVRSGNALIYDPSVLFAHRIVQCPLVPHWEFYSSVVGHGDKMMFVYKDIGKQTDLLRFTIDGKRVDTQPIDLCNHEPSLWPIDVFSDLEVGLLTVWATPRDGDASIHYSVYDYRIGKISGKVTKDSKGVSGVILSGLPGNPATNAWGNYGAYVAPGWSGTVIPHKPGYIFQPASREYLNVKSPRTGQDYAARTQFNLTVSATEGGTTNPPPAVYPHDPNSLVTVRALPGANYRFIEWTGDPSGSANPITVTVDKDRSIRANFVRVESVINLRAEMRIERSYFRSYSLNVLTWAANPENAAHGIAVAHHRVYRKGRTEADTAWTRLAEVSGTVFKYEDKNVPKDSDFVYAVTCVDDLGNESSVY